MSTETAAVDHEAEIRELLAQAINSPATRDRLTRHLVSRLDRVRHEHGERILAAVAKGIDGYRWYGVRLSQGGQPTDVVAVPDLEEILHEARDLSREPS